MGTNDLQRFMDTFTRWSHLNGFKVGSLVIRQHNSLNPFENHSVERSWKHVQSLRIEFFGSCRDADQERLWFRLISPTFFSPLRYSITYFSYTAQPQAMHVVTRCYQGYFANHEQVHRLYYTCLTSFGPEFRGRVISRSGVGDHQLLDIILFSWILAVHKRGVTPVLKIGPVVACHACISFKPVLES